MLNRKKKKVEETTKNEVANEEVSKEEVAKGKADKLQVIHKDIANSTAQVIVKELKENGIDAGNFEGKIADMISASYPMVMMSLMFVK